MAIQGILSNITIWPIPWKNITFPAANVADTADSGTLLKRWCCLFVINLGLPFTLFTLCFGIVHVRKYGVDQKPWKVQSCLEGSGSHCMCILICWYYIHLHLIMLKVQIFWLSILTFIEICSKAILRWCICVSRLKVPQHACVTIDYEKLTGCAWYGVGVA